MSYNDASSIVLSCCYSHPKKKVKKKKSADIVVFCYVCISCRLPVVIIADLIAAGLHEGWADLTMATSAETCGQDIEVPEIML